VSSPVASLPTRAAGSSSPDSTLLLGGVALVVLLLADAVFLALSSRLVRQRA
jgi:hypothetical protein